jgi:hypothetical protein
MIKIFVISIVFVLIFSGCSRYCSDGMDYYGGQTETIYQLKFIDTSDAFIKAKFSYKGDSVISNSNLLDWVVGIAPVSNIILVHSKGIDTIFYGVNSSLKVSDCDPNDFELTFSTPYIISHTFDSVYFVGRNLMLK